MGTRDFSFRALGSKEGVPRAALGSIQIGFALSGQKVRTYNP